MKPTKTTLIAILILIGVTIAAKAQIDSVKLLPVNQDTYQLNYLKSCPCRVEVEIVNNQGQTLFREKINQDKPFVKPYNFRKLKDTEFEFRASDENGTFSRVIKRTDEVNMVAGIMAMPNHKAKVIVEGDVMNPVYVNIYNHHGALIFEDFIDRERGFSKVYDLSRVNARDLTIKVITGVHTLATANY